MAINCDGGHPGSKVRKGQVNYKVILDTDHYESLVITEVIWGQRSGQNLQLLRLSSNVGTMIQDKAGGRL